MGCTTKVINQNKLNENFHRNLADSASSVKGAINAAIAGIGMAPEVAAQFAGASLPSYVKAIRAFATGLGGLGASQQPGQSIPSSAWIGFGVGIGIAVLPLPLLGSVLAGILVPTIASAMAEAYSDPNSYDDVPGGCDPPPPPPTSMDPLVINLDGRGIRLTDVATSAA